MLNASSNTDSSSEKARPYKWHPVSAIALVLFTFIMMPAVASVTLALLPNLFGWDSVRADEWLLNSPTASFIFVLIAEMLTVAALVWFIGLKKAPFKESVGLTRPTWKNLLYTFVGWGAYFLLFIITILIADQLLPINTDQEQALGFDKSAEGMGLFLAFVSLVILPPVVEEILFRGFLYKTLRNNKVGKWISILITSLLFGALHLFGAADGNLLWIAMIDTFILSIVLCYLVEVTGNIWASIGVHMLKNGFVFLNLFIIHSV